MLAAGGGGGSQQQCGSLLRQFFDGGAAEQAKVEERFDALMEHDWSRMYMQFKVRVVSDVFQSRIPDIAQWVIRFAFGYLVAGSDADVLADQGAQLNHGQVNRPKHIAIRAMLWDGGLW